MSENNDSILTKAVDDEMHQVLEARFKQIPLPAHVKTDQVQADYKHGMLHLILPKIEADQQKVVKVNIS